MSGVKALSHSGRWGLCPHGEGEGLAGKGCRGNLGMSLCRAVWSWERGCAWLLWLNSPGTGPRAGEG